MRYSLTPLVMMIVVISLSACSDRSQYAVHSSANSDNNTESPISSDAHVDEETLAGQFRTDLSEFVLPMVEVTRGEGESEGVYAIREADAQRLAFRSRGLAYFKDHPDDPRLLGWLAVTVALPPSYAIDPNSWAVSEFALGPNPSARDNEAIASWDREFRNLVSRYSASTPEHYQLMRYLRWNELRNRLYRERELFVVTGQRPDQNSVVRALLEFAQAFPNPDEAGPAPGGREESHLWSLVAVLRPVLGRQDVLQLTEEDFRSFVDRFSEIEGVAVRTLADDMRTSGFKFTYHPFFENHQRVESDILAQHGSFEAFFGSGETLDSSVDAILYSTPTYPAMNQPQNEVEATRLFHDLYVGGLMMYEKGVASWPLMCANDKYEWLRVIGNQGGPRFFPKNYLAYTAGLVETKQNEDIEERDYWLGTLTQLTKELIESGQITLSQIQVLEVLSARRILFSAFSNRNSTGALQAEYEKELFSLLTSVVARADETPEHNTGVASFLSELYTLSEDASFSPTMLRARFAELPETSSDEIRNTVEAILDPIDLERGTPITIDARTLDGLSFDTTELRGKIVLIDHWDTNCGPCIAAMPVLHEVYERYKEHGVEVVSIAYDGSSQRPRVDRIKEENGLTWTTLDGEGLWPAIAAQYGYRGVPQYMLLDRDGNWYAGTEEMGNGANFEALLNEILASEEVRIVH